MTRSRRVLAALTLAAAGLASTVVMHAGTGPTLAAWRDTEHVRAAVGTLDCADPGTFASNGGGRFLGANVLGLDLDTIVAATGLRVEHDGASATPVPATASNVGPDAFASDLDVALLQAQAPQLGLAVALPLEGQAAGVYRQYGRASGTGESAGAAGAVTDAGAVLVNAANPDPGLPSAGRVHLGGLLPSVAGLADLDLAVGAVAASAVLDACPFERADVRDYGIASLELVERGAAISDLHQTIVDSVGVVQTTVDGLDALLVQSVTGVLFSLLAGLSALDVVVELDVDLHGAVAPLLTGTRSDAQGIVTLDLQAGEIRVDLANLLGGPAGLNGRAPNTELLDDVFFESLLPHVTAIVGDLLAELVGDVVATVQATLDNAALEISVAIPPIVVTPRVELLRIHGTLGNLQLEALAGIINGPIADAVLDAVVGVVTSTVTGAVGLLVTTSNGAVATVGGALDTALQALRALSLAVNVQPDQPGAPPAPPVPAGAVQVSAFRVGVLPVLSPATYVTLATATAGPNSLR